MAEINDKILKHLAELARIEIDPKNEARFLSDFKNILGHFEELANLDTSGVVPMTGGTSLKNITREDEFNEIKDQGKGVESFPESKDGYLKVPPVFE
ncbi:MAG: Asp-tRNA(Asn)/Glu-tRNA(Gln) amidotransferase subunit GatC [Patescibacteria group bacterium]|jgi:aspartyl-tRNA(Asn)/glutamyl-tRNA(Gln) amidotransferase subunit C|nr:Asp-tRNA(Asn)/Glu-tRNA(Gln) amidotransferase subunit GatC [Patescibacteria group bacterium]